MPDRKLGTCMMCNERDMTRYIDLYIMGSEGLVICHTCEMIVVDEIQKLRRLINIGFQRGYKSGMHRVVPDDKKGDTL